MNNISPANSSRPLDLTACPLDGSHLIEASAGTGKTWTITGLYLRLLLQSQLTPEQILVVTFTEDATQELKDRIRRRITSALRFFEQDCPDTDDALLHYLARECTTAEQRKLARLRLDHAARVLDQAAISTIHGFCNRLLQDFAFESGVLFESSLEEHDRQLLGQVIDDYWRCENGKWHPLFVRYLFQQSPRITADQLQKSIAGLVSRAVHHGLEAIIHRQDLPQPQALQIDSQQLCQCWAQQRDNLLEMVQLATGKKFLSASQKFYKAANVESWVASLDHWLLEHQGAADFADLSALAMFGKAAMLKARGKTADKQDWWPENPFLELADQLLEQLDQGLAGLRWHLLQQALQQLPQLKTRQHMMTFDDLLLQVRDGLRREGAGDWLAQAVKQQYPAALIDEFQDTDPVQFEIFSRVYLQPDNQQVCDEEVAQNKNCLFLIGDPKQAIYSFRNADIFAYLQAVQSAQYRWQLGTNWRSEPKLIEGVNTLFTHSENPFLFSDIEFHPVAASDKNHWKLFVNNESAGGLNFCMVDGEEFSNQADKTRRGVADLAAQRIQWLLSPGRSEFRQQEKKGKKYQAKALKAGDIAILVRKNQEGELMRQALARKGIRSVIQSRQSVFQSPAARDIQWLLQAVLDAGRNRNLYALLATPLYQYTAEQLDPLDESELERLQERYLEYHNLWQKDGVAAMLRYCLQQEQILPKVAALADGERRLTDMRHLTELLQQTAHEQKLGPGGLVNWLRQQRLEGESGDGQQLRLESDEALVRIVTIHKSKGLEYPLVFCPFLWSSGFTSMKSSEFPSAHDSKGEMQIWLDGSRDGLGKKELDALGEAEAMAEDLRLLYVALTRPVNAAWIWWGYVHNSATSSLATAMGSLLFSKEAMGEIAGEKLVKEPVKQLKAFAKDLAVDTIEQKISQLANSSNASIAIEDQPMVSELALADDLQSQLSSAAQFNRQLHSQRMLHSFSSIHATASHAAHQVDVELPDYDAEQASLAPATAEAELQQANCFTFPRGANPGSCLHAIFEFSDFTDIHSVNEQIPLQLEKFAIDQQWTEVVEQWMEQVLHTPLLNQLPEQNNFCLADLKPAQRLNELEFVYPVPLEKPEMLKNIFELALGENFSRSIEQNAFLKGFIDLVFVHEGRWYVLDYKSNYLGDSSQDYLPTNLSVAMQEAGYDLQYTIYTIALNRYLKYRLGDQYNYHEHFGGVLYLYLRGMDGSGNSGVYFSKISDEKIEQIETFLS